MVRLIKNYNLERWSNYDFTSRSNHWNNKEHTILYFMVRVIPVWWEGNGFAIEKLESLKLKAFYTEFIKILSDRTVHFQIRKTVYFMVPILLTARFLFIFLEQVPTSFPRCKVECRINCRRSFRILFEMVGSKKTYQDLPLGGVLYGFSLWNFYYFDVLRFQYSSLWSNCRKSHIIWVN